MNYTGDCLQIVKRIELIPVQLAD